MTLPAKTRAPILLLSTMLLASVVISAFTLRLLSVQRAVLDEAVRESQAQALTLLVTQLEQALLGGMRPPILPLKNSRVAEISEDRLSQIADGFPNVEQILLFDDEKHLRRVWPPAGDARQQILNQWLAQRAVAAIADGQVKPFSLYSFTDKLSSERALFAMQVADDVDPAAGWILIRYNLEDMRRSIVAPLLKEFTDTEGGRIELQDAEAEWNETALHMPLTHALPGWLLSYEPDPAIEQEALIRDQGLLLSVSVGAVLALLLASYAAWRELRRERLLVDLRNRFVANVSHELKTPLALIRMYAETLYLGRVADKSRQRKYYETILRESERLTEMINSVLDLERLRQGAGLFRLTETDLRATLAAIAERYQAAMKQRGVRLALDLPETLPAVAHDPRGITQILLNLLNNAADHGGPGTIRVTLQADGDWVDLSVADQGPGLSAEERSGLLAALRRGEAAPSRIGSGLGLALVEQIAAAHHAYLVLDAPEQGSGLRAVVSFPVVKSEKPS